MIFKLFLIVGGFFIFLFTPYFFLESGLLVRFFFILGIVIDILMIILGYMLMYKENLIRNLAEKKKLDFDKLEKILCEEKGNQHDRIFFNKQKIESALPPELLKRDKRYVEEYIIEAIKKYR